MNSAVTAYPGLIPRLGFFDADTQDAEVEADLRRRFSRVTRATASSDKCEDC